MNKVDELILRAERSHRQLSHPMLTEHGDETSRIVFLSKQWSSLKAGTHVEDPGSTIGVEAAARAADVSDDQYLRTRVLPFECDWDTQNVHIGRSLTQVTLSTMQSSGGAWVVIASGKSAQHVMADIVRTTRMDVKVINAISHMPRGVAMQEMTDELTQAFEEARKYAYPFG